MTDLSILCVTSLGSHSRTFLNEMGEAADALDAEFVVAVDGYHPWVALPQDARCVTVKSAGYIESVLDEAVNACSGEYVLRLDDDEKLSSQMLDWLLWASYREADHWAFPRMHLWPDTAHYFTTAPLWPDLQTRLSVKAKAGGRPHMHQGSPYGTGQIADGAIEHHKFLIKNREQRERQLERYGELLPGADGWAVFSVPERFEGLHVEHI